jgi:NADH:ubiquinone oxidoreductase subunit 6 (subunit J)
MPEDIDLKQLERKAYLSYHQDGLLDIGLGLFILAWGVGMATDMAWMAGILAATGISIYAGAKKVITIPRVGLVQFGPERVRKEKKEKSFFVLFFTVTAILGIMMFALVSSIIRGEFGGSSGMLARSLESFVMAPLGLIGAVALIALGYWKELRRFYVYAALLFLAVSIGPLLKIAPPVYTSMAGGVITLAGLVMLVRFLQTYPLVNREAMSHVDQ